MAKARTAYVCSECGADFNKWQGQCGACGAWDTLSEIVLESAASAKAAAPARRGGWAGKAEAPKVTPLAEVRQADEVRVTTGIGEFDRVLGGGIVPGSIILVGGDPGVVGRTLRLNGTPRTGGLRHLHRAPYALDLAANLRRGALTFDVAADFAEALLGLLALQRAEPSPDLAALATKAAELLQTQNRIIKSFPEVASVWGKAGRAQTATDPAPMEMFETIINLKPEDRWRPGMTVDA